MHPMDSERRLRVLFCLEDLCFGGTQRQTIELARRLDTSRFAVKMLVFTGKTDLDAIVEGAGIPIHYIGTGRGVYPFFFLAMPRLLVKDTPDLLVPCTALPNIWARIWGAALGIPVVGTCRGGGGPVRQHERFLWRLTAHLICNTSALQEDLQHRGVPADHITVIENGIDTERFVAATQPSQREPMILCIARLAQDKDHMTLFRAFEHVVREVPEARLVLVGDGPEEHHLKHWAREHADLAITFVPGTDNVAPWYEKARLFVLSSVREGQPNVLLEAMSEALPICATDVGGIPHMMTHGNTGLLCPSGRDDLLARNIITLLKNPVDADDMGQRAREAVVERYSFSRMVEQHEEIFLRYGSDHSARGR